MTKSSSCNALQAPYPLRPHHVLCIRFFEGKGYSREFTTHMQQTINTLNKENAAVRLTLGGDIICSACPNFFDGSCEKQGKAHKLDALCLTAMKLKSGMVINFKELSDLALEKIIKTGLQTHICASCQWSRICIKNR